MEKDPVILRWLTVIICFAAGLHLFLNAKAIACQKYRDYKNLPWPLKLMAPGMKSKGQILLFRMFGVLFLLIGVVLLIATIASS